MTAAKTTTIAQYTIEYLQFLDANSALTQPLPDFAQPSTLLTFYTHMARARALDIKAINLQRTGKIGGYASCRGQEAIGVATASALLPTDVLAPHYRDQAAQLIRGNSIAEILAIWSGDEHNHHFQSPNTQQDLPPLIPIAAQCLHAAGIAKAFQYRQENRVVAVTCGDGGTSKGDFYEAINVAGQWQLPMVFIINNNQWAISVPRQAQSHAQTLAQKAIAAGIPGLQVDGNDVIALYHSITQAIDRARRGDGPTLIEAITYRLCDHTTADDAKRYQPASEVKAAWQQEPIARLGHYLEQQGHWSRAQEAALQHSLKKWLEPKIADFLARPAPKPTDMIDYLYARLPHAFAAQRSSIEEASS